MNKIIIIGNLTREPELSTTSSGNSVCNFTVAVNRRKTGQQTDQPESDYFRVTAWRQLGELCAKYLSKGRKVSIVGTVGVSTYEGKDGTTKASLEVTADEVEFLSAKGDSAEQASKTAQSGGFTQVDDEELPF